MLFKFLSACSVKHHTGSEEISLVTMKKIFFFIFSQCFVLLWELHTVYVTWYSDDVSTVLCAVNYKATRMLWSTMKAVAAAISLAM